MADPVGLIGVGSGGMVPARRPQAGASEGAGPDFADLLRQNLREVNDLQADASRAVEDLMTGRRDDLEGVILATEKADTAFRMLQGMRNKVMGAFEELKQMRV